MNKWKCLLRSFKPDAMFNCRRLRGLLPQNLYNNNWQQQTTLAARKEQEEAEKERNVGDDDSDDENSAPRYHRGGWTLNVE